jgi:capsular exopolysaccharide synthesis family protein
VNQIPQNEKKLLDVSRQQQIKNNIYSFLLQKREETALAYASSISDSQIIDPAVVNPIPVSPKWYIVLPISILFSLLAFLLHILKKDFLTKKVKFRNQIEESFDLPVSAEISHVSKKIRQHILNESLYKTFKDQIKRMAYSAGILHLNTPHKTILVTSSIPNEGKTFIATNLAYNLSELNRKILLLDLDLRRNKLTHNFNLQGSEGFSEWIFQTDVQPTDYIYETEYNNMHIMPSGRNQTDVTEILLSKGIADNLKILSSLYDYIIIDTPPIDPVNDAFLLSDLADKIIYIIRHNHTPKTIMTNTSFLKKIKSMKNTAIIFNDVKSRGFVNKYYGNTFGYGYESVYYGKKRYENM